MLRAVIVLALLAAAVGFWWSGRQPLPQIDIQTSTSAIGQDTTLTVTVDAHGAQLSVLDVSLQQNEGPDSSLFALPGNDASTLTQLDATRVQMTRPVGRRSVSELRQGKAVVTVTASHPAFFGLRTRSSTAAREFDVRLTPPSISVLSRFHFINHGGSELVVYRVSPPDARSGVRVGELRYPSYAAKAAGIATGAPDLRVAFFALLHDQDLGTPIAVYATDEAGNTAEAAFEYRVTPRPFRRSRIEVDDRFLSRVVPAIQQQTPDFAYRNPSDLLESYLQINGEMRRENDAFIAALASKTAEERLWDGPFRQLTNSKVEASFADNRTYFYDGREVDRQVHLGFDLAVTSGVRVTASNAGVVLWAGFLGIYGNCVILDHGLGVQSLYAHLSAIDVAEGARAARDQPLGRSGMTGLAGGDHVHFTMLVGGHPVSPVDWWSAQWIEDRLIRKLREAAEYD
jgi:murein DD-endopeptidase MepM/ murein hydrolase activator NlpD